MNCARHKTDMAPTIVKFIVCGREGTKKLNKIDVDLNIQTSVRKENIRF